MKGYSEVKARSKRGQSTVKIVLLIPRQAARGGYKVTHTYTHPAAHGDLSGVGGVAWALGGGGGPRSSYSSTSGSSCFLFILSFLSSFLLHLLLFIFTSSFYSSSSSSYSSPSSSSSLPISTHVNPSHVTSPPFPSLSLSLPPSSISWCLVSSQPFQSPTLHLYLVFLCLMSPLSPPVFPSILVFPSTRVSPSFPVSLHSLCLVHFIKPLRSFNSSPLHHPLLNQSPVPHASSPTSAPSPELSSCPQTPITAPGMHLQPAE